ncbi:alpha/beta hydrolase [Psychrobacter sp.]|uniref:alpha/beta fold hydrolase n=1 Tax=Psychrobacter sp. TaxID=56811 RepID=UPI0025E57230|nr:alpha/beta hydrolase [Psychrobacter sp.]
MPMISINGAEIYYEDSAPEQSNLPLDQQKPVMLFAHGLLWGTHLYDKQVDFFKKDYRCIAFDFRGQGKSEVTKTGYDMYTLADDAIALLQSLVIDKCHFIGLSMGGYVAQRVALKRPDLLHSLILLDTAAEAENEAKKAGYKKLLKAIYWIGLNKVGKKIMAIMFGETFLNDKSRKKEYKTWLEYLKQNNKKGAIKATIGVIERDDILSRLSEIQLPTLIVVGDEDKPTPYEEAQKMHFAIKGSKLAVIKQSGHSTPVEQPEQLNAVLKTFLMQIVNKVEM